MGKFTISRVIFHSYLSHYQRADTVKFGVHLGGPVFDGGNSWAVLTPRSHTEWPSKRVFFRVGNSKHVWLRRKILRDLESM